MSFIAACPHCKAKFAAQDHLVGKNVRCPKCKVPFRIGDVASGGKKKKRDKGRTGGKSAHDEDLPIARPAQPKPTPPASAPAASAKPLTPPSKPASSKPVQPAAAKPESPLPAPQKPKQPKPATAKPAAEKPAPAPARSWKEIAQELAPEPPTAPPQPAAVPEPVPVQPTHATPPPEQAIVLNPTIKAAWEALPPIILATSRHEAVELPPIRSAATPDEPPEAELSAAPAIDDLELKTPDDLLRPQSAAASKASGAPAPDEVIELGFEDLVIEEEAEEIVELSDDDFLDDSPAIQFEEPDEVITEVEVIEEAPRRSSATMAIPGGPQSVAAAEEPTALPPQDKRRRTLLVVGGGGGVVLVLIMIAVLVSLGGGSSKFQPSASFRPTSTSPLFIDPSGKVSIRFPEKFGETTRSSPFGSMVHGATLMGESETFSIYYTDSIPIAIPPSGAKPLPEHWVTFNLQEMAYSNSLVSSIRRHKIGSDYAVEYRVDADVQRHQPGESRILLIFIGQRMFLVEWSGERYRDEVDDFFDSFSIGDARFDGS
ncbi:MJ0042-type zinc finger domain-containing protein [Blastopirellula marina]|uniref:Zinc finger/thioredoxin putative domain-containing protein n=1 Tax=Blastopirellula marina TaxID=124 RepID=A0A2S8GHZ3_9BACT|nr:MJ0042-type zinc finger domain-containing protein [Blastopirellula marina]PQO44082.1 hypothetical protein C5Y93_21335 [Blastopirellula marina]